MVVLVAHEGEKAACYSLVYDEVEGCAEGYHTAPGETADKVPLMDGCSLEIIVCGFHEYRQYQQYSNGAGESRKAAEKAAEQVFLFRHMYMHRRLVSRKRLSVMGASRNMLPGNRQSRVAAKRAVHLSVSSAKSS